MATRRFHGWVGYAESVETTPGVAEDVITEVEYFGDVDRPSRRAERGDSVNGKISANVIIDILADDPEFSEIQYVKWEGTRWQVTEVSVEPPRLQLRLGGVYHGPVASPENSPGDDSGD